MSNQNSVDQMIALLSQNEELMNALKSAIPSIVAETGDPSFARFSQAFTQVSRTELKPLFGDIKASMKPEKAAKAKTDRGPVDNTWRSEQKALFTGRGLQWIYVDLDLVKGNIGPDDTVTPFFEAAGQAWVRYSGPRIVDGNQMAAFEVRESGSKVPSPKNLIYIAHQDVMDEMFLRLDDGKTPFALGLESSAPKSDDSVEVEVSVNDETPVPEEIDELLALEGDDDEIDDSIF